MFIVDGILPLFKPKGPTSHDCVFKLRKILGQKKVGHTGTLDPEVEGVLPICLGEGTKVIPFLTGHVKEYIADIQLGRSTTTEDALGETVTQTSQFDMPSDTEINRILNMFTGNISQVPPMYSAVKVRGKKLYEYARQGIEIERPVRQIMIHELEQLENDVASGVIRVRVVCSKGTYIRTLCVDIGKALGIPAHMGTLIRTVSDGISFKETVTFTELEEKALQKEASSLLLPVERLLTYMDAIQLNEATAKRVSYGQKLPLPEKHVGTDPFKMMYEDKLLAIYEKRGNIIKPVRVFNLTQK